MGEQAKIAAVTGGAQGIGRRTSELLASRGYRVAIIDLRENASNAENATISKSAVQSLYKDCLEFPELQPSDFPAPCKNTLKRSCSISDIGGCKPQGNSRQFRKAFSFGFFQCAEEEDRLSTVDLTLCPKYPWMSGN
jgi:short chain dehydrogenase